MLVWNKISRVLLLQLLYAAVLVGSFYLAFHLRFEFYPGPYMDLIVPLGSRQELPLSMSLLTATCETPITVTGLYLTAS